MRPLEASEELSQPHPLAPMYPLRHFWPQMAPFLYNSIAAPLYALDASEELSQPHPLAPMYPLRHFRPEMPLFVENSIDAPP